MQPKRNPEFDTLRSVCFGLSKSSTAGTFIYLLLGEEKGAQITSAGTKVTVIIE
jgi:hypothetical protein